MHVNGRRHRKMASAPRHFASSAGVITLAGKGPLACAAWSGPRRSKLEAPPLVEKRTVAVRPSASLIAAPICPGASARVLERTAPFAESTSKNAELLPWLSALDNVLHAAYLQASGHSGAGLRMVLPQLDAAIQDVMAEPAPALPGADQGWVGRRQQDLGARVRSSSSSSLLCD